MARRRHNEASAGAGAAGSEPAPEAPGGGDRAEFWDARRAWLAVAALLTLQAILAVRSLLAENPTIDEVVHLPAGVSYWQTGDFRLYPHNPPLVKLLASLPVLAAGVETGELYQAPQWGWADANKAAFAHGFAALNAERYFDLFDLARLGMPVFGLIGGLFVFLWSRRLWGTPGALVSLTLWTFCPNILAHTRLITTDVAATSLGLGATFVFWRWLKRPGWGLAVAAGVLLGLAQLCKFSNLLLLGLWPIVAALEWWGGGLGSERSVRGRVWLLQTAAVGLIALFLINAGYGFRGVGERLGSLPFTCRLLTKDRPTPLAPRDELAAARMSLSERIRLVKANRFAESWLGAIPMPVPRMYLMGFDDQKLEAEGIPARFLVPYAQSRTMGAEGNQVVGYPVFLDGELSDKSWRSYYLMSLLYKVPEGTWVLWVAGLAALAVTARTREAWADRVALLLVPGVVLGVMSLGTNIAIGLRYVLPMFPYLMVAAGGVSVWFGSRLGVVVKGATGLALGATALAAISIQPHFLAYFNWASGGVARGSEHLIDSNLDWGQDLVGLERWYRANGGGEPIGIAYFGQINPSIFEASGRGMPWFLPPALPGTLPGSTAGLESGPPRPGLYAVSASLMRGLPWRVYGPERWEPYAARLGAFRYFAGLEPVANVGHSILIYRLSDADSRRLARLWGGAGG